MRDRRDDTLVVPTLFLYCDDGATGVSPLLFDTDPDVFGEVKGSKRELEELRDNTTTNV